ncbi:T-complex protein 1 alpha subunit [Actinidia rufa]|uniref:T-complex protein 1 alpha subunit n=1 Tax=Actinidia rufa TaxID=165716 RepID=A0A7J0F1V4_9ERIC|nr:T-complex protein 1 alpha subunit [Actinidia rufa]
MIVDDIGDVTVSNDGATILKMLDFEHPAAKVLVELAELQEREVGDGTTSAAIIAADLLKVAEAMQAVKMTNAWGEIKYPIKGINILKAHGKSAKNSYLLNGYALNTARAAQGMPPRVTPARIACLGFNLQGTKMQLGIQVLVTDLRELEKIRQREADTTKERIEKLLKAGANYFVEAGAIAVRRVRKEDIHHVAKAAGATVVSTFVDMEGEETFDSSLLGHADEVVEEHIADNDVSLILRGANDYMLDEMERALYDSLSIAKRTLESNTILAVNAAKDATKLVAKLRAYHHLCYMDSGLDLSKGTTRNTLETGVFEPAMSKVKIIQFATEASIRILRVGDMIMLVKDESQKR